MSELRRGLRTVRVGLLSALITIAFGFVLGGAFGAFEHAFKSGLERDGAAVLQDVYEGDEAKLAPVLSKAWSYHKRAHLHAGGIGAASLGVIVLLALLGPRRERLRAWLSAALGVGGFGYALFWLLAGQRAPGLGGTGAAKESLNWLAVPSAGALLLGLLGTVVLGTLELFGNEVAQRQRGDSTDDRAAA